MIHTSCIAGNLVNLVFQNKTHDSEPLCACSMEHGHKFNKLKLAQITKN